MASALHCSEKYSYRELYDVRLHLPSAAAKVVSPRNFAYRAKDQPRQAPSLDIHNERATGWSAYARTTVEAVYWTQPASTLPDAGEAPYGAVRLAALPYSRAAPNRSTPAAIHPWARPPAQPGRRPQRRRRLLQPCLPPANPRPIQPPASRNPPAEAPPSNRAASPT